MYTLDETDKKLLMLLQENSKRNVKELALRVGLTASPTFERIKRLEKKGIIKQYVARLDKEKIGLSLEVFCQVTLQVHSKNLIQQFEHAIATMPEIVGCYHIAGNFDYLLKIVTPSIKSYQSFLKNKLSVLESVATVQSNFVLSALKDCDALRL